VVEPRRASWSGFGPGWILAAALLAPLGGGPQARAIQASARDRPPPIFYHNERAFRIPFDVQERTREVISEVHLYVSADQGLHWDYQGSTQPDQPAFPFQANRDGEYWFAVRTRDREGRLHPSDEQRISPRLKVVIDTTPPSLVVGTLPRRGGVVGVRWDVQDEYLDLSTLRVEYRIEGAPQDAWRLVRLQQPRIVGEARWEVETALPLTIRVSVEDKAGNVGSVEKRVERGLPDRPVQSVGRAETAMPGPPPIEPQPERNPNATRANRDRDDLTDDPFAGIDEALPGEGNGRGPARPPTPVARPENRAPRAAPPDRERNRPQASNAGPRPGSGAELLVASSRFPLEYTIEDAAPSAVEAVEMWMTTDGGRTWESLGADSDRRSPFHVDLGGDGRYGLTLVIHSSGGFGDAAPVSGDAPQLYVTVDQSPPKIALESVARGEGKEADSLVIEWRAEDAHPAEKPIVLSVRADRPDAIWQQITARIPNTGRYVWPLPRDMPARFHVRIDAFDALDNRAWDETEEPITLQTARPRGVILGIDPGSGVNALRLRQ